MCLSIFSRGGGGGGERGGVAAVLTADMPFYFYSHIFCPVEGYVSEPAMHSLGCDADWPYACGATD